MKNTEIDIDHLRTFFVHSKPWLNIHGLEKDLGLTRNKIYNFVYQKLPNGKPQGLGTGEEKVLAWVRMETNYNPTRQYDQIV